MLTAVRSGLGLAVLPCYLGDSEPTVVRIGGPIPELQSELWLLTHPDLRRAARIRAFLDFTADALRPSRPPFEGERPILEIEKK